MQRLGSHPAGRMTNTSDWSQRHAATSHNRRIGFLHRPLVANVGLSLQPVNVAVHASAAQGRPVMMMGLSNTVGWPQHAHNISASKCRHQVSLAQGPMQHTQRHTGRGAYSWWQAHTPGVGNSHSSNNNRTTSTVTRASAATLPAGSEEETVTETTLELTTLTSSTDEGSSSSDEAAQEPSSSGTSSDGLSKAEARKARRSPPTLITPPRLPDTMEQLSALFSNGALLIDKPLGWTSFDVCGKLRNTLKFLAVKKVGHAGTLDPLASGLLIVCTGQGTKFCDDFMALEKEYSGVIRLGEGTATYDSEGEVIERMAWEHITDDAIQAATTSFVGDIKQVPPMYSAIKMGGQKLYDLAREGVTIDREPRPVTITEFKVWRADPSPSGPPSPHGSQDLHFHVACSKGTYIRSLAYDLGRALGTVAHLKALRRESIGAMRVVDSWQLDDLLTQLQAARALWGPPEQPRPQQQKKKRGAFRESRDAQTGSGAVQVQAVMDGQVAVQEQAGMDGSHLGTSAGGVDVTHADGSTS